MKFFTKKELFSLIIIFLILVSVSWPNFALSLRRARDQTRRDDIGNVQSAIDAYYADYGVFPLSTSDGKMVVCKNPNSKNNSVTDPKLIDLVACTWGQDAWINLTPGVNKTYMSRLPGDPNSAKGVNYVYFSDGSRYQLFASLESSDEPGYDAKLAARHVSCGIRDCNMGRVNNVPMYITIEEYDLQIYCGQHPKELRCIN